MELERGGVPRHTGRADWAGWLGKAGRRRQVQGARQGASTARGPTTNPASCMLALLQKEMNFIPWTSLSTH